MKKTFTKVAFALMGLILFSACGDDDSATEEFSIANGNITPKFIKTMTSTDSSSGSNAALTTFNYDSSNRLISILSNEETTSFVFENGTLVNIIGDAANTLGDDDNLSIAQFYEAPYDAFELGEAREYDANLNPRIIDVYQDEFNQNSGSVERVTYTSTVEYEAQHNLFFYTMQAAGIIDVLDGVRLNLSMMPVPSEIAIARALLPVNNFKTITTRNAANEIVFTINATYVYDSDNYPTSATVTTVDIVNNETDTFNTTFTYKN
ncbi:hypothetical protein ULMS_16440 [Patiriisocius marinistellae]|uniref:DUF4595 domain-containing protein n=1 Tax=Patiriisocius marinistellae TaxID=2494560 RepID=A0A5J4G0Z5_9FLAO|nr:hypothetical protein [Patiriisocius marinistellae]GEQ86136.1 hypothetical protein ULMS_16440 [Patiriisocius marinistellae]